MKKADSDFDEYLLITILADLFDDTDSIDIDLLANKITNGLEKNDLLTLEDENDYIIDDIAAA